MDRWPSLFLTSCVRYRPDCPEVWPKVAKAAGKEISAYQGERAALALIHVCQETTSWYREPHEDAYPPLGAGFRTQEVYIPSPADSRDLGGPRASGWTQMTLAFLRSWLFQEWAQTSHEYMLQVDSDVELHPGAIESAIRHLVAIRRDFPRATLSLQIDNRIAEDHEPCTNAMVSKHASKYAYRVPDHIKSDPVDEWFFLELAPYADDGSLFEVARSGACTLYPREALAYRPTWQPGYREEHQAMFDQMRADGWRHFLLRDPSLTTHHMKRAPSLREERERMKRQRAAEELRNASPVV